MTTMMTVTMGQPQMDMNSHGDTWDSCWADDGHTYISSDDTRGFNGQPPRNLQFHVLRGDAPDQLRGETVNTMDEYGTMSQRGPDGCMWKACGNTCVDGVLYAFVSRHEVDAFCHPEKKDPSKLQTAANASLIMSGDKGKTWRRTAQENYDSPMFPGQRFGSPYFVKYGQDGKGSVHNAGQYVYAVANNGFWENGDNMILGRVPRARIGQLNAADWQFHRGGDGMLHASWSPDIRQAKPMLVNPGKCSMTGVQYIAPLKQYLMVQWYYTKGSGHLAPADTTWLFYQAPAPWGPWQEFGAQRFPADGYYNPGIATKFISPDGRRLVLFTNGNFTTHAAPGDACRYRLTQVPCSLSV